MGHYSATLLLRQNVFGTLAISAGLGYYSIFQRLFDRATGATVGAIALLANIIRELLTILFTLLVKLCPSP